MTDLLFQALPGIIIVTVWGLSFLAWCARSPERLVWLAVTSIFLWMTAGAVVIWGVIGKMEREDPLR